MSYEIPNDIKEQRFRPLLLATIAILVVLQIVALSPSSIEEGRKSSEAVSPEIFMPPDEVVLAEGIPQNQVPDYSVDDFNYMSTQGVEKQWKLVAERAYLYNAEKLVHAKAIKAYLYDSDGKITVVTGKEAKYFMNKKDLEVYGDVQTIFPDGFTLNSPYLRYRPQAKKVEIPARYSVHGTNSASGKDFEFDSRGLDFDMNSNRIVLPNSVRFNTYSPQKEKTTIVSDHCLIRRDQQIAYFMMYANRPLESRFVQITQPSLFVRSRTADFHYGDHSESINYMVAHEDVLIRELDSKELKYATGGQAAFDAKLNVIILTIFPQVYQANDTVTGEKITLHRDTDVVEVEQSNAFSDGN